MAFWILLRSVRDPTRMYSTSTQKRDWTFASQEIIDERREKANYDYRGRFSSVIQDEETSGFFTPDEELHLCRMISERGVRFGDAFRPPLLPSIRWMAFAYFKRFYLTQSAMEYSPKFVMTACYYLATKIDEFYVPINEFVTNLQSGTAEQNMARILALEPDIMRILNYQLTVHCPFRPFEGHLMEMKRSMLLLNFDIESLRPAAMQFLRDCLVGDAMLLYAPTHIALAAIKHSLDSNSKSPEVMKEFVQKLLGVKTGDEYAGGAGDTRPTEGEAALVQDKLLIRLEEVVECVQRSVSDAVTPEMEKHLQQRSIAWLELQRVLEERKMTDPSRQATREEPVDSDDDV